MTRFCRLRCRLCGVEWEARDPVREWHLHWRDTHDTVTHTRVSIFTGVMGR